MRFTKKAMANCFRHLKIYLLQCKRYKCRKRHTSKYLFVGFSCWYFVSLLWFFQDLYNSQYTEICNKTIKPLVTIVTATHNSNCTLLLRTSRSLAKLTVRTKWIIVKDHWSTIFCKTPLAYPFTILENKGVRGLGPARQVGIQTVSTKYFILLDDDDMLSPTSLEKALWVLEHMRQISICGWFTQEIGYHSNQWRAGHFEGKRLTQENRVVYSQVVNTARVRSCGAAFRVMPNGMEDWDFWLQLSTCGLRGHTIPTSEFLYRTRPASTRRAIWPGLFEHYYKEVAKLKKRYPSLQKSYPVTKYEDFSVKKDIIVSPGKITCGYVTSKDKKSCSVLMFVPRMDTSLQSVLALNMIKQLVKQCHVAVLVDTYDYPHSEVSKAAWEKVTTDIFETPTFVPTNSLFAFVRHVLESRSISNIIMMDSFLGLSLISYIKTLYRDIFMATYIDSAQYLHDITRKMKLFNIILASNNYLKFQLTGKPHVPNLKLMALNVGVNIWNNQQIETMRNQANGFLEGATKAFRIMYIGHIDDANKPFDFLTILEQTHKRIRSSNVIFYVDIFGSGPFYYKLKKQVEQSVIDEFTTMHGEVKRINEIVCGASLLVLSTQLNKRVPKIAMEAMACGVPVLGPSDGAFASIVVDKDTGFLCQDMMCFISTITELVNGPSYGRAVGRKALSMVRERFNYEHNMAKIVEEVVPSKNKTKRETERKTVRIDLDKNSLKSDLDSNNHAWADDGSTRSFAGVSRVLQRLSGVHVP